MDEEKYQRMKNYLYNYKSMQMRIGFINRSIDEIKLNMQAALSAPIAKYGTQPGGGTPELIGSEAKAEIVLKQEQEIAALGAERQRLKYIIDMIDIGMGYLHDDLGETMRLRYIEHMTWRQITGMLRVSTSKARTNARRGILALMNQIDDKEGKLF